MDLTNFMRPFSLFAIYFVFSPNKKMISKVKQ